MPNQLQSNGGNAGKQTKAAPIYTGRFFSGLYTNRSPLRDAKGNRLQEKFYGPAGDALIDGANLEVTNKLTLGRRPGNPIYDTVNEWQNILSFDEFRVSKALSDAFGTVTEAIYTMVSEGPDVGGYEPGHASLSAINSAFEKQAGDAASAPAVWTSGSPSAGQTYGVQVGNEFYFGNGVDNKKWLQTLFQRTSASDSALLPLNSYPFMTTYFLDGNNNMQQLIGAIAQYDQQIGPNGSNPVSNIYITNVSISDNVLTLTVNSAPYNTGIGTGAVPAPPVGTSFMIWGTSAQFQTGGNLAFLQGATITITESPWTSTTINSSFIYTGSITESVAANTGFIQIMSGGSVPSILPSNYIALGASRPNFESTAVPSISNDFVGGITVDGQALWVNRGETVENWGIEGPDEALTVSTFGATAANWQPNQYYSPASLFQNNGGDGALWMLVQAGTTTGLTTPFPTATTLAKKLDIYTVQINGNGSGGVGGQVIFGMESVAGHLSAGDSFTVYRLRTKNSTDLTQLNGLTFVVDSVATGSVAVGAASIVTATSATHSASADSNLYGDAGYAWLSPNGGGSHTPTMYPTVAVAGQAQFMAIQSSSVTNGWKTSTHYYEDDFIVVNGDYRMLYKGVAPFLHSLPPQTPGWQGTLNSALPTPVVPVTTYFFNDGNSGPYPSPSASKGAFQLGYTGLPSPSATQSSTDPSLWFQTSATQTQPQSVSPITPTNGDIFWYTMAGNAYLQGSPFDTGFSEKVNAITVANIYIPNAIQSLVFTLCHNDGAVINFPTANITGPTNNLFGTSPAYQTPTTNQVGTNMSPTESDEDETLNDSLTATFSSAGCFAVEIDWCNYLNFGCMILTNNGTWIFAPQGQNLASGGTGSNSHDLSWQTQITFQGFSTSQTGTYPPAYNNNRFPTMSYSASTGIQWGNPTVEPSQMYWWMDIGPQSTFQVGNGLFTNTFYNLSGVGIVYNGAQFLPYTAGVSGTTIPASTFTATIALGVGNVTTTDGASLRWMYIGSGSSGPATTGKLTTTSTQGYIYVIALVNTLDNTVSNASGSNEVNGVGLQLTNGVVVFAPGEGLDVNTIDPQSDYVAIYRTTDGGSLELLIPSGGNTNWTVPLAHYLQYGYIDDTPDTGLDDLVQAAVAQENTPPAPGAVNLAFSLNRIWYSIGNTTWYTSGPNDPSGNGLNGAAPGNTDTTLARVTRLEESSIGMLVFTLSDVIVIPFNGPVIQPGQVYIPGVGLSNYNALDYNGTTFGLFTTDHQLVVFEPQHAVQHVGHAIANLFRLDLGEPGLNWNPTDVYVAWYVNGEDMGWFVADSLYGWYRLIDTPAPDSNEGPCWSTFANINPVTTYGYLGQGCGAIKSVEVAPGDHRLLIGPALGGTTNGYGSILYRDLDASADGGSGDYNGGFLVNGTTYPAYGVFGSYICGHPGQVAMINFITTDQVNVGSPNIIGVIFDEALPYYTGSFDIIKDWVPDPPNLPESTSILGQRFWMSEAGDGDTAAMCRHMQVMVQYPAEAAQNELLSFTIYGSFAQMG